MAGDEQLYYVHGEVITGARGGRMTTCRDSCWYATNKLGKKSTTSKVCYLVYDHVLQRQLAMSAIFDSSS